MNSRAWCSAGFPPDVARRWSHDGVHDPSSATEWIESGFRCEVASSWTRASFKPSEAAQWSAAGLDAPRTPAHGVRPDSTQTLRSAGGATVSTIPTRR